MVRKSAKKKGTQAPRGHSKTQRVPDIFVDKSMKKGNPEFGWGQEFFNERQNIYVEDREHERNCEKFGEAKFDPAPAGDLSKPQKKRADNLRKEMPWQVGWTFAVSERKIYGKINKRGPQNMGNCVGYAKCLILAARMSHELAVEGDLETRFGSKNVGFVPYIPYSYGAGRCLSGNMCGGGDGSYCSVSFRAAMDHGFLPCDTPGLQGPFPQPSSRIGRLFGSSKRELMKWRDKAVVFDLEHSHRVQSEDDMWVTITERFMPVEICSNWGFRAGSREGWDDFQFHIHRRSGSWAHAMQIIAAFEHPNTGERYYMVANQWGNYHKDGWWFVVDSDTMRQWLRQADARAAGEIKGRQAPLTLTA